MNKKTSIFGIILVLIGLVLLLNRFQIHLFQFLLPGALIGVGIWLIYRQRQKEHLFPPTSAGTYSGTMEPSTPPYPTYGSVGAPNTEGTAGPSGAGMTPGPDYQASGTGPQTGRATAFPEFEGGKVKYSKFLGDMFIECQNVNLQNVEISMFVGDLQVNLRGGKLAPGLNRMIISGFLGDIMVLVPRDIPVFVHCSGFVGDVDLFGRKTSGFGNTLDAQSPEYDTATSKLYIAANNFIGDVRVYIV